MKDHIEANGIRYAVNVHIERRRGVRASIGNREINIRIPSFMGRGDRERHINQMKVWIIKQLEKNPDKFMPEVRKEYNEGDFLRVGEEEYRLSIRYDNRKSSKGKMDGDIIRLVISEGLSEVDKKRVISRLLSRIIAEKRLPELERKIRILNNMFFQSEIKNIRFKYNKSNWGSCTNDGNINISTRLLLAPDKVLEYVCIHELAHRIEFNHSERFWRIVEEVMPNYMAMKKWLRENGDKCYF